MKQINLENGIFTKRMEPFYGRQNQEDSQYQTKGQDRISDLFHISHPICSGAISSCRYSVIAESGGTSFMEDT